MKSETLNRLINDYIRSNHGIITDGLGEHISIIIEQEKNITHQVHEVQITRESEKKRREEFDDKIAKIISDIQSKCPHWETSYYGDPAGGSDSFTECDLCKKQW